METKNAIDPAGNQICWHLCDVFNSFSDFSVSYNLKIIFSMSLG